MILDVLSLKKVRLFNIKLFNNFTKNLFYWRNRCNKYMNNHRKRFLVFIITILNEIQLSIKIDEINKIVTYADKY